MRRRRRRKEKRVAKELERFHLTTHQEAASPGEEQRPLAVQLRAAGGAAHCPAVSAFFYSWLPRW